MCNKYPFSPFFRTATAGPEVQYVHLQYLKKNQNAPRPPEHPPVRGGEMSKRLGWIKGSKYKTSSWHLNGGSPIEITLGQQYNVGEKPTVILHTN